MLHDLDQAAKKNFGQQLKTNILIYVHLITIFPFCPNYTVIKQESRAVLFRFGPAGGQKEASVNFKSWAFLTHGREK